MSEQRRVHERHDVVLDVALVREGTEHFGRTQNVSLGGMFIELTSDVPFGADVSVRVTFPALKEPVEISSVVRWKTSEGVGVQFGSLRAREVWAINQLCKS